MNPNVMSLLHNRIDQKILKQLLNDEVEQRTTLSFYKYFQIEDPNSFRDELYKHFRELNIFGRIYIAPEGINAQLSVPESNYAFLKNYLGSLPDLKNLRLNIALENDGKSFWVLKVKVRPKIVADGIDDPEFSLSKKGEYVDAVSFNQLAKEPDTVIVDMRNHYEYEVGHFENAIEIPSETFREQLPMAAQMLSDKKDKNIIMYCTGGIRCEKASAYMLHHGFKNVHHLEGGIIQYANKVKEEGLENKFLGKNFVFDGRLGEKIGEKVISHCHQCGAPSDLHVNCANEACHLLFIQCKSCSKQYDGCCSEECFNNFHLPEEERKEKRKGLKNGIMVFNKSRKRMESLKKF